MGRKELYVELLRYTPAPEEVIAMGAKLCYSAAQVSDLRAGVEASDQTRFIGKLVDMGHFSPIEHSVFTFGVEGVSRSLLAQITRHRIASFSVQSQRYVLKTSKQSEEGVFDYIIPPRIAALGEEAVAEFDRQMRQVQAWYDSWNERLGAEGETSNEDARFVLPNAAETKLLVTMNARELLHFFRLRCCNRAQWEIRALAEVMLRLVRSVAPSLFKNAGPGCLSGPCPEGKMTCGKMAEVRKKYVAHQADL
ncbi:MAG: FAD-dependent thymidylate synthase [bacterium]|jgi:thymidylate synthase (FAD)